ncbi:hypothetical protein DB41_CJ00040 [Neochlamydia sp. TUME1]|nr:hypothetical protein DB41_CJ00040 [Neochlamydia sp. TUME1]
MPSFLCMCLVARFSPKSHYLCINDKLLSFSLLKIDKIRFTPQGSSLKSYPSTQLFSYPKNYIAGSSKR